MKTILKNVSLIGYTVDVCSIVIEDNYIKNIHKGIVTEPADSIIDCRGNLVVPGFYNTHAHPATSILPMLKAGTELSQDMVYASSLLGICNMLRSGTVSFSDSFYFCDETAMAVADSGIRANLSRRIVLDDTVSLRDDLQFVEARRLIEDYNGFDNGRIKCEVAFDGAYYDASHAVDELANYAATTRSRMQIGISRYKTDQEACALKRQMTPVQFLDKAGLLKQSLMAVHVNWITERDMELLAKSGVTIARCPSGNLNNGRGILSLSSARKKGARMSFGTDDVYANGRFDMFREIKLASLLQRSSGNASNEFSPSEMFEYATTNGAIAQGRRDCGTIKKGSRADLVILNCENAFNECYDDDYSMIMNALDSSDVMLTMVEGRILYQKGEFKTIDMEQLRYEIQAIQDRY